MTPAKRERGEREVRVILCGGCVEICSICQRQVQLLAFACTCVPREGCEGDI